MTIQNETGLGTGLLFVLFSLIAVWRLRAGSRPPLRPIAAYSALRKALSESAESARPLHISLGGGGLEGQSAMQTLAGLQLARELAQPAATGAGSLLVTTASPLAVPLVQNMLRRSYAAAGAAEEYDPVAVRFVADTRAAYAIGALGIARDAEPVANALVGDLRDEYLLVAEPLAQLGGPLVAGTGDGLTQPFVWATADLPLLGEEIFASGAYLGKRLTHIAGLAAQDSLRLVLVLIIIAGMIYRSLT